MRHNGLFDTKPFCWAKDVDRCSLVLGLNDGSHLSCSSGTIIHRWRVTHKEVLHEATYTGLESEVLCALKTDRYIIAGADRLVALWDVETSKFLFFIHMFNAVTSLLITKDNSTVVLGSSTGVISLRRASDLSFVSSFEVRSGRIDCICELEDGSFISGGRDSSLKRWEIGTRRAQNFAEHSGWVTKVIELKRNVVVSASRDGTVRLWQVDPQCFLYVLHLWNPVCGLLMVDRDLCLFATGSDKSLEVWNERLECIQYIETDDAISTMTRLEDGSIVTGSSSSIEIRRM